MSVTMQVACAVPPDGGAPTLTLTLVDDQGKTQEEFPALNIVDGAHCTYGPVSIEVNAVPTYSSSEAHTMTPAAAPTRGGPTPAPHGQAAAPKGPAGPPKK